MNLTIPFQFSILSKKHRLILCLLILVSGIADTMAQPVTGVWRGRIIRGSGLRQQSAPIEIKFVAQGDSIVGTSYYYGSGKSYVRYSIKGHFGMEYNTVVWKDYHMVEMYPEKPKEAKAFAETMKIEADYSCPDGRTLRLDGIGRLPGQPEMKIELRKMENTFFPDEWDDVIDGYFTGMARKEVVDSVWSIASEPYRPRGAAARASDDIAAAPAKAPDRDNTSITARPATEVKASPARPAPAATVVTEMQPDTLAIAKAEPPTEPMVSGVNGPEKKVDSTMV
ncbi:MAG TPA: hypothetical protein VK907_09995, partial [Phnomibacter sp.]|nr:hypothetical protein [Phnomibacter sp.]